MMSRLYNSKRGFTAFFAMLTASLALSVGLAIYDLLIRELSLSQVATQSQYAIFAADTGAECALFWDAKYDDIVSASDYDGSAFATSSAAPTGEYAGSGQGVNCNGLDIVLRGPPASDLANYQSPAHPEYNCVSSNAWCIAAGAAAATTTFSITFPSQPYCAIVVVTKYRDPSSSFDTPPQTTIVSHGYNNCTANGAVVRLERALQVSY